MAVLQQITPKTVTQGTGNTMTADTASGTVKQISPTDASIQIEPPSANPIQTATQPQTPAVTPSPGADTSASGYNTPGAQDTVEGRIGGLLNRESDYMKRAETKGLQFANKRNLANSSMAAEASQASAMDAALPIAQQDADWANRNRMQADTMANERVLEQYRQENLAWSQFIKGISDINMQDLDPTAKEAAVQNLRDNYFAGSGIAASLRGVTIKDGKVTYPDVTTGSPAQGGAPQIPGEPAPSAPSLPGQTDQPTDPTGFSKQQGVKLQTWVNEKFSDYLSDTPVMNETGRRPRPDIVYRSALTGQWFTSVDARKQYDGYLAKKLTELGIPLKNRADYESARQYFNYRR